MVKGKEAGKSKNKAAAAKRATGLGRGLNALMGDAVREAPVDEEAMSSAETGAIRHISVADIKPNPDQPRRYFDEVMLEELARSIGQQGLMQPILLRPRGRGYEIVAGERRWRASQKARLHKVPAIIREFDDAEAFEIAVVENIQREDLNVMEEAEAYVTLRDVHGHSQAELAGLVGKSRSHVANLMRLTELPDLVRTMVADGRLQMGHARALIHVPQAVELAKEIVSKNLSVRETEILVRKASDRAPRKSTPKPAPPADHHNADIAAVEKHLSDLLGMKVAIGPQNANGSGTMAIDYSNLDQLDMLCQRLTGEQI